MSNVIRLAEKAWDAALSAMMSDLPEDPLDQLRKIAAKHNKTEAEAIADYLARAA